MSLEIITKGKHAPKVNEETHKLHIMVVADTHDELDSPTAKRLAYDYREDRACPPTFGGAGIEGISGTIMVDGRTKDDDQRPAREFVLTKGMN